MPTKLFDNLRSLKLSNAGIKLLYLFLVTDLSFLLLHLIYSYTELISNEAFSLDKDRGYSEIFQYIKEYWIALLLSFLAVQKRTLLYFSWSLLFFYLLLDDATELHERFGFLISNRLNFTDMFSLRAIDFGELIVSAGAGLFFLILIGITHRFSDRSSRKTSKSLIILLFALTFFGVIVDMLHIVFKTPLLDAIFVSIEDGGELMIMSLIVCFVFSSLERFTTDTPQLSELELIPAKVFSQK